MIFFAHRKKIGFRVFRTKNDRKLEQKLVWFFVFFGRANMPLFRCSLPTGFFRSGSVVSRNHHYRFLTGPNLARKSLLRNPKNSLGEDFGAQVSGLSDQLEPILPHYFWFGFLSVGGLSGLWFHRFRVLVHGELAFSISINSLN